MKHRYFISIFLILVLSLSLLTACGQKTVSVDPEDTSEETLLTDSSGEALKVIGIKSGSNTVITLKNKTGQNISDIAVKASNESDVYAGLLSASDEFQNNESRILYYTISDDKSVTYDLQMEMADGTECVLHNFPFNDTDSCTIWMNGVAYIDYLSDRTGAKESTRDTELNILLAQEEGITLEELVAKQTVEATPTPSPSPSAAVSTTSTGSTGSSSGRTGGSTTYNGGSSSYSGGSSGSGGGSSGSGGGSSGSTGGSTDTSGGSNDTSGGSSSGSDTSGGSGSSGGSSGGSIGGDEAYMDDDISGYAN